MSLFGIVSAAFLLIVNCSPSMRFSKPEGYPQSQRLSRDQTDLWSVAQTWLDVPYRYAGADRQGIDCSALVYQIYREVYKIELPRTARAQWQGGKFIRQPWLQVGDLLFFREERGAFQDHVGLYLGDDQFIHASVRAGVVISKLSSTYYQHLFVGARRYLP